MEHPSSNLTLERAPELAGRYVIERELGRGTMGVVYEAHDTRLGRTVAVKTIELAFSVGPNERADFEQRFFNEARVAARLSHPGIVVCHDVGKDPATGQLFIVFECLKGRTLAERMAPREPMSWPEALTIVAGVARAIHHAHEHGIVHRDLKPANVFLLELAAPSAVKILDFGVARVESMRLRLTASGQSFGSPLYMSPEQALGQPTDARSDIFSLGSILCTLLLGRPWFEAPNIPAIFARLLSEEPPQISTRVPDAPAGLDAIVRRAMAKQPGERYRSAADLAEDLEQVMAGRAAGNADMVAANNDPAAPTLDLDSFLADLGGGARLMRAAGNGDRTGTLDILTPLLAEPVTSAETPLVDTSTAPFSVQRRRGHLRWLAGVAAVGVFASVLAASALRRPADGPLPNGITLPNRSIRTVVEPIAAAPSALSLSILAPPAPVPTPKSWVMLDVKHSLRHGRLKVWVDGAVAVDASLHAPVTKRIVAIAIREGRLAKPLEIEPGRRDVKVQVTWDGERRLATTSFEAAPEATRILEIRLAGRTKDLRLDWK